MSSKKPKPARKPRKFDSTTTQPFARQRPVGPPPPPAQPPAQLEPGRSSRAYVWIDGARLSLPTAWLQHRMSRLRDLDDAWTLYALWQQDYWWWSGGSLPENPEDSFRKAVEGCRARLRRQAGRM